MCLIWVYFGLFNILRIIIEYLIQAELAGGDNGTVEIDKEALSHSMEALRCVLLLNLRIQWNFRLIPFRILLLKVLSLHGSPS